MSDLEDHIKTKFKNERQKFLTNLVFTTNWVKNGYNGMLTPFGISGQQFNILRILRGAGDWVSMNDVKKLMIDKSPHTTRMTNKLLDKQLVKRKRSENDRRVVFVSITEEGLKMLAELDTVSNDHMKYLENISLEEAELVNSVLDKLRK